MPTTVAHHLFSSSILLAPANSPSFIVQHYAIWYGILLPLIWVSCPGSVLSWILVCTQPLSWAV